MTTNTSPTAGDDSRPMPSSDAAARLKPGWLADDVARAVERVREWNEHSGPRPGLQDRTVTDLLMAFDSLTTQLSEAEAALGDARRVISDLQGYAAHTADCSVHNGRLTRSCDCGIAKALKSARTLSPTRQQAAQREGGA